MVPGDVLVVNRTKVIPARIFGKKPTGGKVEMHEDKKAALVREIKEELGVDVKAKRLVNRFEDEIPELKIYVYLYDCSIIDGEPQCLECQDLKWVTLKEASALKLAPVDKKIVGYLERRRLL